MVCLILPGPSFNNDKFEIISGNGSQFVSEKLYKEGFIYKPFKYILKFTLRILTNFKSLIPGEFLIRNHSSLYDIIVAIFIKQERYYYKITIIEGITAKEALAVIDNNKNLFGNITLQVKEGTLMPDTYFFFKGTTKDDLIKIMIKAQEDFISNLWENRTNDFPLKSIKEVIILSSLIEKEAAVLYEKPIIASVLFNRLKLGVALQTDPSVAYGVGKKDLSKITTKDLKNKNAYNTYLFRGLPKGPISLPSKSSITSVFYPCKTTYLYFVATGNGTHIFSSHLSEHNKAVRKWRMLNKKNHSSNK